MELGPETLIFKQLTWLIAQKDFINIFAKSYLQEPWR